jgi:hypothetical protein
MDESQARLLFKSMSLEQCIKMWNESLDHYTRAYEVHSTDEDKWWEWLVKEAGGFLFVIDILSSGEGFNITDSYFFYDKERRCFISFSTKQEFIEVVGDAFFINEIQNGK